jgi:hypothetical protein
MLGLHAKADDVKMIWLGPLRANSEHRAANRDRTHSHDAPYLRLDFQYRSAASSRESNMMRRARFYVIPTAPSFCQTMQPVHPL